MESLGTDYNIAQWTPSGVVVAVHGTVPGPSSGITYDVRVNLPNAPNLLFSGVVPFKRIWPDFIDIIGASVGDAAWVMLFGNSVLLDFYESPVIAECES